MRDSTGLLFVGKRAQRNAHITTPAAPTTPDIFRFIWPHDGTVLFIFFRMAGFFRPKCTRDEVMIRSPPSFRSGRHYGSFLMTFIIGMVRAVCAPFISRAFILMAPDTATHELAAFSLAPVLPGSATR